jgi:hypothetical protein
MISLPIAAGLSRPWIRAMKGAAPVILLAAALVGVASSEPGTQAAPRFQAALGAPRVTPPLAADYTVWHAGQRPGTIAGRSDMPAIGGDIAQRTRTCQDWRTHFTPTSAVQCAGWDLSGPVNVVLMWAGQGPFPDMLRTAVPGWQPAHGNWLVAQAQALPGTAACEAGWQSSGAQLELRLDPATRRHVKLVAFTCGSGSNRHSLLVGGAHTDRWDKRCGDHAVDWDTARDALVAALEQTRLVRSVEVRSGAPAAMNGGCGLSVRTDGSVVYLVLGPPPSQGSH